MDPYILVLTHDTHKWQLDLTSHTMFLNCEFQCKPDELPTSLFGERVQLHCHSAEYDLTTPGQLLSITRLLSITAVSPPNSCKWWVMFDLGEDIETIFIKSHFPKTDDYWTSNLLGATQ